MSIFVRIRMVGFEDLLDEIDFCTLEITITNDNRSINI